MPEVACYISLFVLSALVGCRGIEMALVSRAFTPGDSTALFAMYSLLYLLLITISVELMSTLMWSYA